MSVNATYSAGAKKGGMKSAEYARRLLTVAYDVTMLVFCDGEQRRPAHQVLHVEVEIVVFGERIEVCEVHVEEILGTKWTEGRHRVLRCECLNINAGSARG